jgi:hypothetical protein
MRVLVKRILRKYGYPQTCKMLRCKRCCNRLVACRALAMSLPAFESQLYVYVPTSQSQLRGLALSGIGGCENALITAGCWERCYVSATMIVLTANRLQT